MACIYKQMKTINTSRSTINDGEKVTPVFSTKIRDINGVNPADKLAATEYKTDKTVQRKLIGNISANITGTVA